MREKEQAAEKEAERKRAETENTGERLLSFCAKCVTDLSESFLCQHHGKVSLEAVR